MQHRYRAKRDADPERRAEYLQKEREKWQRDQETGEKKKFADLSERDQRAQRKKWKQRKGEAKLGKVQGSYPIFTYNTSCIAASGRALMVGSEKMQLLHFYEAL